MPSTEELKFKDTVVAAGGSVSTAGEIVPATGTLNVIAQGTGESERIGRKVEVKYIGVRYTLHLDDTTVANQTKDTVRVILYQDKQANGATAGVLDILDTASYQSFNNLSNKGRFRVLADRVHSLQATAGAGTTGLTYGEAIQNGSMHIKCNTPIEFNSTTGAITEIVSNNLGFLVISSDGHTEFDATVRLRYSD